MRNFSLLFLASVFLFSGCDNEPDVGLSAPQYVKGYRIKYEKAYIDGALAGAQWRDNTPVIYITNDFYERPEEVRNWVLLHEYCHLELRMYDDDDDDNNASEKAADCCAIKLLSIMWDNWVDEVIYYMQDSDPERASSMLECYLTRDITL